MALVLMAMVGVDLLDAACDPLPGISDVTSIAANTDGKAEACAGTCVADCFCCSALDGPLRSPAAEPLDFLRMAALVIAPAPPTRTSPPPDQPPTRL